MNMACATATITASTVSTHTATSRQMCHTIDAPRRNRCATTPSAGTARTTRNGTTSAIGRRPLVPVAHAPHRQDPARLGGVGLDLLAQPSHVDGHRGLVAERPAPHRLQQL